jgi:peptide deformylase
MAQLTILDFPDERLRTVAVPVVDFGAATQSLIDDMFESMYEAPGIGLAATQVDRHIQLIVIDVSEEKNQPLVFINPSLSQLAGQQVYKEGCLSVPSVYADVKRADSLTVAALDRHGKPFVMQVSGLLAVCVQHEMDHLLGKVFLDYLTPLKRTLALAKLGKALRERKAKAAAEKKKAQAEAAR